MADARPDLAKLFDERQIDFVIAVRALADFNQDSELSVLLDDLARDLFADLGLDEQQDDQQQEEK